MASASAREISVPVTGGDTEWSPDLDEEDLRELNEAKIDPTKIIYRVPREENLLGYYSVLCLIFNRMIGTGIFNSASIVFSGTQSIGISLLLWGLGAVVTMAGVLVYIELGLSIPRWPIGANGEKIATPRSGEALNYFNYMLKRPLFLATCMFGITFLVLANTAANSVSFAQNILDASHQIHTPGKIIAIALAANTFSCLLHAISRKGGIILNNVFGTVKLFILLFFVLIGLIWLNRDVASSNYDIRTSFSTQDSPKLPYRYAEAFTYVLYPYTSFHQINLIISEVRQPRKTFPRAQFWGVLTVATIYTAVIMVYVAIIPKAELFTPGGIDVGARFFQLTIGNITSSDNAITILSSLKAISAIGNIIVVTFTTARVKQEIAKEGILPYSLVFASSYDFSLRRIFGMRSSNSDEMEDIEETPVAALALHWVLTTVMVVLTIVAIQPTPYSATPAQSFLAGWFVYDIDLTIFTCISLGLLLLHFSPRINWARKSAFSNHPILSITSSFILLFGCLFPLLCLWIPDPAFRYANRSQDTIAWYAGQTAGVTLLGFAFMYWVVFRMYISIRSSRNGETLYIRREPVFKPDPSTTNGGLTQVYEIVTHEWRKNAGVVTLQEIEERERDGVGGGSGTGRGIQGRTDESEGVSEMMGTEAVYELGLGKLGEVHELDGPTSAPPFSLGSRRRREGLQRRNR